MLFVSTAAEPLNTFCQRRAGSGVSTALGARRRMFEVKVCGFEEADVQKTEDFLFPHRCSFFSAQLLLSSQKETFYEQQCSPVRSTCSHLAEKKKRKTGNE